MKSIGLIHSPFKEKFSIPRQPGLTSLTSTIELSPPFDRSEALAGLELFSHVWVIFLFHETNSTDEKSLSVRPPRLGGNQKQGVFATRSPFRPNNIGLSLVKILKIDGTKILIEGGDFLDQTPLLDLKPYLPSVESIPEATGGWTDRTCDQNLEVLFENNSDCDIDKEIIKSIREVLSLDPRPSYHKDEYKNYGSKLFNYDVHWLVKNRKIHVTEIIRL
ncbi:MAG: tRNA (N6-threonylcarbamoyladenosine(37)-N6)-methyltransferase TrmO [Bacteriovoracaceae bacterium]|nr:tRNA (N6-threonylcarbamoyladenosine(37)-N6)-methyltransferase TrmO [Bacteriovoracaceae bacterium]